MTRINLELQPPGRARDRRSRTSTCPVVSSATVVHGSSGNGTIAVRSQLPSPHLENNNQSVSQKHLNLVSLSHHVHQLSRPRHHARYVVLPFPSPHSQYFLPFPALSVYRPFRRPRPRPRFRLSSSSSQVDSSSQYSMREQYPVSQVGLRIATWVQDLDEMDEMDGKCGKNGKCGTMMTRD